MLKKRLLSLVIASAFVLIGCGSNTKEQTNQPEQTQQEDAQTNEDQKEASDENAQNEIENIVLKVGASPAPHKEILDVVVDDLAEQGITLEIIEFTDYVLPNKTLDAKEIDANFFQHTPFLMQFNEENGTDLVVAGTTHYEPLGIYPGVSNDLSNIKDKSVIAVPNDATNEARALMLLETNGVIKLKEGAGLNATKIDIVENPHNVEILEVEAAQTARYLQEVDFAVINGNYAIANNIDVATALAKEESDSVSAETYANIIAVNAGDEQRPEIQALVNAIQSDEVKAFIDEKYKGAVVALFK